MLKIFSRKLPSHHGEISVMGYARKTSLSFPVITDRSRTVVLMWSLLAVLVSEFR